MSVETTIASPLSIILEHPDVDEILLTSFNSNLGFWERFGLGPARGLGATVTLISDAAYVDADPHAVRQAGRTYLDGRAVTRHGVFHPKVTALVSKEACTLIVGSGNVTVSGWLDNAELWTVITATPGEGPTAVGGFTDWITRLPHHVQLSPGVDDALTRIAKILARYHPTDSSTRFVHNLTVPLIDQLPSGPVDELVISSPFFDKSGTALARVLDKLQPSAVVLATQDTDVLDGAAVLAAIERFGAPVTVKHTVANRYYHGKLIEWSREGTRFGLTGSPNMSKPALLQTVDNGGNVEAGVIASHPIPLEPPDAQPADTKLLANRTWTSRDTAVGGPSLLSVTIEQDAVVCHLGRPLDTDGTLQFFTGTAWELLAPVPPNATSFPLTVTLPPATPVRLVDGAGKASGPVFITNPMQVTRPRRRFTGRTRSTHDDVFRDAYAFELMVKDLLDLRSAMPVREPATQHHQPDGHPATFESWRDYLDHLGSRISPEMLAYGLSIPYLGAIAAWDEDDAQTDPESDPSDPTGPSDPNTPTGTAKPPSLATATDRVRIRYKRGFTKLADQIPQLPPSIGITILRLILTAGSQHLWTDPDERLAIDLKALSGLLATDPSFQEEKDRIAAAGVVVLAAAAKDLRRVEEERRLEYDRTGRQLAETSGQVSMKLVNDYAGPLRAFFGPWLADTALETVAEAFSRGPPGWVSYRLNEDGHRAQVVDGIVNVERGDTDSVDGAAMRALETFKSNAAQARSAHRDGYATYRWDRPHLLVDKNGTTTIYRLKGILASSPGDYITTPLPRHNIVDEWKTPPLSDSLAVYGFATM